MNIQEYMMVRKKLCGLLITAILGSIIFLQAEMVPIQTAEHHLFHKVVENHSCCVSAVEGDKIFLRPESIISTNHGLFINLNGAEFCPLPLLLFNGKGHFVQGGFMEDIELVGAKKEETMGPCPQCGVNTNRYGICKNTRCFFYGFRVL